MRKILGVMAAGLVLAAPAAWADEPIKVMVVGMTHLSNPGRDVLNIAVDDVLSETRQAELAAINDELARFAPTAVAVEWPADVAAERYAKYLDGTLEPSRNEVVQIGFRLAKTAGLKDVWAIDAAGEFPFDAVQDYATAHGQQTVIDEAMNSLKAMVAESQKIVDTSTLGALLRHSNTPERILVDNAFYRTLLRVGGGADQPGAKLLSAWQLRNNLICANLIQKANSGDRVVVLFGSGHSHLLRQCVSEMPGFELVEPNDYLPQ